MRHHRIAASLPRTSIAAACSEAFDLSEVDESNVEHRLDLIDLLYRQGYLPWGKGKILKEIESNGRIVRLLGGPYGYIREWVKMGLDNVARGRRARSDGPGAPNEA